MCGYSSTVVALARRSSVLLSSSVVKPVGYRCNLQVHFCAPTVNERALIMSGRACRTVLVSTFVALLCIPFMAQRDSGWRISPYHLNIQVGDNRCRSNGEISA